MTNGPESMSLPEPDLVARIVESRALRKILAYIPASPHIDQLIADTASTEAVADILAGSVYLGSLAESIVTHTAGRVPLTKKRARPLGVCVAAATLETGLDYSSSGSYAAPYLIDDVQTSAARAKAEGVALDPDQMGDWLEALSFISEERQEEVVATIVAGVREKVDKMPVHAQAVEAATLFVRYGTEGRNHGSELNPWERRMVEDAQSEAAAITQITYGSGFARGMHHFLALEPPFNADATPTERYTEAVGRTLALVGRSVTFFANASE